MSEPEWRTDQMQARTDLRKYFVKSIRDDLPQEQERVHIRYKRYLVDTPLLEASLWGGTNKNPTWCKPGLERLRKRMGYRAKQVFHMESREAAIIAEKLPP